MIFIKKTSLRVSKANSLKAHKNEIFSKIKQSVTL